MDYQWHYDRLIETRKDRVPTDGTYYEKHHIIMRSMGGTDDKENIVKLTAREHFLAHWLLWRIHRNSQSAFAFYCMTHFGNNKKRFISSSKGYAEAKEVFSKKISKQNSGINNSFYGKKHSDSAKKIISDKNKLYYKTHKPPRLGKKNSDSANKTISEKAKIRLAIFNPWDGKTHSIESKNKMSESKQGTQIGSKNNMFGKTHSEDSIKKMSLKKIGLYSGDKNPRARKIYQYSSDLDLVNCWSTAKECADLYNISRGNISKAANKNSNNPQHYLKLQNFIFSFSPITIKPEQTL
jgi:hypothetical protein